MNLTEIQHNQTNASPHEAPAGHGPYRLTPNPRAEAAERRKMRRELGRAVETSAFGLMFLPRLSLATGRMLGAEALPFWPHKRLGSLQARSFMPLADLAGHGVRLGGWSLEKACATAATAPGWPAHWRVSVRVSSRQLVEGTLIVQLAQAFERTGLAPDRLELALDEALLADIDVDTLLTLSAIRDLGVGVALDDFGTGFASLIALKRLPLTAMKLDRSLIQNLPDDREDAAILRALVSAGHALGFEIVACGIETERQRTFLAGSGCDAGQGRLFSNALTEAELSTWIATT
jgi:EAL domain-containing protein (putative c-di-GMP-specific phosphodiesterase class I)